MSDFQEDAVTVLDALSKACLDRSQTLAGSLPDDTIEDRLVNKARGLLFADIGIIAERMIEIIDGE
jgi:hypothetical protein